MEESIFVFPSLGLAPKIFVKGNKEEREFIKKAQLECMKEIHDLISMEKFCALEYKSSCGYTEILHRSTKNDSIFQLSCFDKKGPSGHECFNEKSVNKLLKELSRKSFRCDWKITIIKEK